MILRNYYSILSYGMFGTAPTIVTTDGRNGTVSSTGMNIPGALGTLLTSYGSPGVVLGTGDAPATLYDYKLAGNVISGFVYSKTTSSGRDAEGAWAKAKYTITNNNANPITIREVGVMQNAGSAVLVERTVLGVPITIEGGGGVGQLEYTVRYNAPDMEVPAPEWDGTYGVEWDYSRNTTKLTRFGAAANYAAPAPAEALDAEGSSPFDTLMPWAGMKRYNIVDGVAKYSEDDDGFDMTANDTMVYIPEFYFAVWKDPYGRKMRWAISHQPRPGFLRHPGSDRYVGRYHTSNVSSTYRSLSGKSPVTSITRATARTNSHKKGDKWWMLDFATWSALQLLYLVEFANWNSQANLGTGQDSGSVKAGGGTDAAVYHTLKRSKASNQYRWVEDPFSNVFDFVDGFVLSNTYAYINIENESNGDTTANHTYAGTTITSGYTSGFYLSDKYPWAFLANAGGGSESTYVTDEVTTNSDVRVLYVGGSYSAAASAGFFRAYMNAHATSNGTNVGSRLLFIP